MQTSWSAISDSWFYHDDHSSPAIINSTNDNEQRSEKYKSYGGQLQRAWLRISCKVIINNAITCARIGKNAPMIHIALSALWWLWELNSGRVQCFLSTRRKSQRGRQYSLRNASSQVYNARVHHGCNEKESYTNMEEAPAPLSIALYALPATVSVPEAVDTALTPVLLASR